MDLAICGYIAYKFVNADSQCLTTVNNLIDLNLNQNPKTPGLLDGAVSPRTWSTNDIVTRILALVKPPGYM